MAQRPGYIPIPGSDTLTTKARGESAAAAVEAAGPASLARVEVDVGGHVVVVGPAVVQGRSVPLLLDVMDRFGPLLSPESFVVYLQLYRLALADGKNACRVSLGELSRRTRLRDRRLGKAVADLVAADMIVLVDRTRDGTLYRVRLPDDEEQPPTTTKTAPTTAPTKTAPTKTAPTKTASTSTAPTKTASTKTAPTKTAPTKTAPKPAPETAAPKPSASTASTAPPAAVATSTTSTTSTSTTPRSVGDVCTWFAARFGSSPGRGGSEVAAVVMELLEDGVTFARIPALLEQFVKAAPKTTPLRDLQRVLAPR